MPWWFVGLKAKCPACGGQVPNEHPPGRPRTCSDCGAKLQFRQSDLRRDSKIGTALTAVAALAFGRGWWQDLLLFAILFLPVGLLVTQVSLRLFPPKLEPYDGHKMLG